MQQPGHTQSSTTLFATYAALIVLAGAMIGISRIDVAPLAACTDSDNFLCAFGHLFDLHTVRTAVILGIALVMGVLVAAILMGLAFEKKLLNTVVFLANFPFLAIFVVFTWADHAFRGETDKSFTQQINWESPVTKSNEHSAHEAIADSAATTPTTTAPVATELPQYQSPGAGSAE